MESHGDGRPPFRPSSMGCQQQRPLKKQRGWNRWRFVVRNVGMLCVSIYEMKKAMFNCWLWLKLSLHFWETWFRWNINKHYMTWMKMLLLTSNPSLLRLELSCVLWDICIQLPVLKNWTGRSLAKEWDLALKLLQTFPHLEVFGLHDASLSESQLLVILPKSESSE